MRGQVLLLVILILSCILALTMTWGLIAVQKLRTAVEATESVRALYAAESGVECQIYKRFVDPTISCLPHMTNETDYTIEETESYIRAIGRSRRTYRAMEVSY